MNLRIAICDDEQHTLNSEYEIISSVLEEEKIENTIDRFNSPEDLLNSEMMYNIVFLDIEMGELHADELQRNEFLEKYVKQMV